mmetsp:Transcript_19854/g.29382  ORF Transcript_19854/g.29382 Transcript_19854/m.29382 type:complete len:220 (+) Transcript_19854:277-936(+)
MVIPMMTSRRRTARRMRPTTKSSYGLLGKTGAKTRETTDMSLIKMLRLGPEVSLNGSPTVSPVTVALWRSDFLGWPGMLPASTYFLALSQAPPALAMVTARRNPEEMDPTRRPAKALAPRAKPTETGTRTARAPGRSISPMADLVAMATQRSWSGTQVSMFSARLANWALTSSIMSWAPLRTESMVRAANTKGSMAPMRTPGMTTSSMMSMPLLPIWEV